MNPIKLSAHVFKKGKFITPLHMIPQLEEFSDEKSWTYGRMPEYLWIGLLFKYLGRDHGLKRLSSIISLLHKIAPTLETLRMSEIIKLSNDIQSQLYDHIIDIGAKKALSPLTVILTLSKAPTFAKKFYCIDESSENRCNTLAETMQRLMNPQSNESTDVSFIALYFVLLSGKFRLQKNHIELLSAYPNSSHNDEIMHMARPMVRSLEAISSTLIISDTAYISYFWRCISEMTDCALFSFSFLKEERDFSGYMEKLHNVFVYFSNLFTSTEPLDDKMNVLLGIATYSYKRLKEAYEHNLFNSISGRSCVRVLIEDFIMMKYLVANENSHDNIWRDYQIYGLGLYKLVLARHRESAYNDECHFDDRYIEMLINEFKEEDTIDMDTNYFDNQSIRNKALAINEKELYGLYYDYDSSFEHGLWGAIRESSLLKCTNPAHKYHCVPDVEDTIVLKSVLPDCVMIMNKTLLFLDEIYGVPEKLLNEVIHYEIEHIDG